MKGEKLEYPSGYIMAVLSVLIAFVAIWWFVTIYALVSFIRSTRRVSDVESKRTYTDARSRSIAESPGKMGHESGMQIEKTYGRNGVSLEGSQEVKDSTHSTLERKGPLQFSSCPVGLGGSSLYRVRPQASFPGRVGGAR